VPWRGRGGMRGGSRGAARRGAGWSGGRDRRAGRLGSRARRDRGRGGGSWCTWRPPAPPPAPSPDPWSPWPAAAPLPLCPGRVGLAPASLGGGGCHWGLDLAQPGRRCEVDGGRQKQTRTHKKKSRPGRFESKWAGGCCFVFLGFALDLFARVSEF
jgi:hypothetical protein